MAIVVNKPLPEFEANATGGIKVSNVSHQGQILITFQH
ncbi:MAG TPA: peroxiredoxin, partial [Alicycliphilus sp.]|nr:peroxiredoxin [Alicycliphilus sp.]